MYRVVEGGYMYCENLEIIKKNERIAIIGAGELGRQIAHLGLKNNYRIVAFFDDYCQETHVDGIPCLGKVNNIYQLAERFDSLIIAIGYKHMDMRRDLFVKLKQERMHFATIVDKSAIIDGTAKIGDGTVIMANVVIDKGASIGDNVFIYYSTTIAHDSIVGSYSFLSSCVAIAGFTIIGESSFLGINTTITDNLVLCPHLITGGGAVVVNNILQPGIYVGVPAKLLNKND